MINIKREGNYFIAYDPVSGKEIEHPRSQVKLKQTNRGDNVFTIYYSNQQQHETSAKPFEYFINEETSQPFPTKDDFKSWFRINTGGYDTGESNSSEIVDNLEDIKDLSTAKYQSQIPVMRTNESVPSGFLSVLIMRLSGNVTVDAGNGTNALGGGQLPRSISIEGSKYGDQNGVLEAITITGGTWQWTGLPQL